MADFITNTEMKGPYRWDFPIKNKNMDKPTSEKDVIKSLPPEKERRIRGMTIEEFRSQNQRISTIKPVFDKMLAALKAADAPSQQVWDQIEQAIKEAEELGL